MSERIESPSQQVDIKRYLDTYDITLRDRMILDAQHDRDKFAKSYRGFKVGCSVLAVVRADYGMEEAKVFSAANFTPEDKKKLPEAKWCAERTAINLAVAEKGVFIPAIVTVSSEVDTGEGGSVHSVLRPCPQCRDLLKHCLEDGTMDPETKVSNVNDKDPENLIISEMALKELLYPEQAMKS